MQVNRIINSKEKRWLIPCSVHNIRTDPLGLATKSFQTSEDQMT